MNIKIVKVSGSSMIPFLRDGYVFIEKGTKDFKLGDMVLYNFMGKLYIHRIYGINGNIFVISNDDDIDSHYVDESFIIGRVKSFFNGHKGYLIGISIKFFRKIKKFFYGYFQKVNFLSL